MSSPSSPLDPTHSFGIIPGTSNLSSLIKFSFFSFIVYQFLTWLYRITLHPLAKYPGPKIWGATALAQTWYALHGDFAFKVAELHAEYGPVVRIGPRAVSFINEKAWEDIHGRYDGRKQLQKAKEFVPTSPPNGAQGLVFVRDDAAHARIRRNFSHGFSDKALRQQGPLIAGYFEALLDKMTSSGRANEPLNVMKWFQLTIFDIVSDLTYGESMGCMKEDAEDLHQWIKNLYYIVKAMFLLGFMRQFFRLDKILLVVMTSDKLPLKKNKHRLMLIEKLNRRLEVKTPRSDFMQHVIQNLDSPEGITKDEMLMTSSNLLMAGAETTAMTLAGAVYLLCRNPDKLSSAAAEVRRAFSCGKDVDMTNTTDRHLPYLHGVIEEALRLFPPVPTTLPRTTPPEDHIIDGAFVPGGCQVLVNQLAAFKWPRHFARADCFEPERWLPRSSGGDGGGEGAAARPAEYDKDVRGVLKPFSTGPRNCIGKHLAYAEIRVILAKILCEFDLELMPESVGWMEGLKIFGVWEKTPLMVRFNRTG
ncbi:hypothetical protein MCOR08_004471 [Pyricularia oryzae]|nr:hypothetical protein MCOR08_004471 [Pyricularia oryzae]